MGILIKSNCTWVSPPLVNGSTMVQWLEMGCHWSERPSWWGGSCCRSYKNLC